MTTIAARIGKGVSATWWGLLALLSIAVALFSYRYIPRLGPLPHNILGNLFARPWLLVHVTGASTALLVGAFQFIPALRKGRLHAHRWMGRVYVLSCLVGGVAGIPLALGTTAGPVATAGFGLLAVLWIFVNLQGWRLAMARDFTAHRRWMIRSWALTLAAVTLRLYMPTAIIAGLPMQDAYPAISFLCWVPNLVIAEAWLGLRPR